jgi:hypothetical protein
VKSGIELLECVRTMLLLPSSLRMEIADSFCHSAARNIPEDIMSSGPPVIVQ